MISAKLDLAHASSHDRLAHQHELKCWPQFFEAILADKKRHDLRRFDRQFEVGDHLLLREFDPVGSAYTGRQQLVEVTFITSPSLPCALSEQALGPGYCILSIARIAEATSRQDHLSS